MVSISWARRAKSLVNGNFEEGENLNHSDHKAVSEDDIMTPSKTTRHPM